MPVTNPVAGSNFTITGIFSPTDLSLRLQTLLQQGGVVINGWTDNTPPSGNMFTAGPFNLGAGASYVLECSLGRIALDGSWIEYAFAMCEFDVVVGSPLPTPSPQGQRFAGLARAGGRSAPKVAAAPAKVAGPTKRTKK
jgi:hypothetical protein